MAMTIIKFSGGITIYTNDPYRIIKMSDGLYVTGNGLLCAVTTYKEGEKPIAEMKATDRSDRIGLI
jgi:hypothetical protein